MSALLFWSRLNGDPPLYSPYRSEDTARGAQAVNRSSGSISFVLHSQRSSRPKNAHDKISGSVNIPGLGRDDNDG